VVGTLLIIAIGVINIVGKVQKVAEPVVVIVKDIIEIDKSLEVTGQSVREIYEGGERLDLISNNFRSQLSDLEEIPDRVALSAKNQLVEVLSDRDNKLRELFPNLTEEKQTKLLAALARIGEERGEDVLISLFADHITEVDSINQHLQTIHTKEAPNITMDSNMQAGLMLASSVLELLITTVDDLKKNIDETTVDDLKKTIEATIDN
jgi:regulator of replication initiation timing